MWYSWLFLIRQFFLIRVAARSASLRMRLQTGSMVFFSCCVQPRWAAMCDTFNFIGETNPTNGKGTDRYNDSRRRLELKTLVQWLTA